MLWRCTICGYIHDGDAAPGECPRCGSPSDKFTAIPEDKVKLIHRARVTNALHQELAAKLALVLAVAERGIEDNLDPGCVNIFTTARDEAFTLGQMIKAEIEIHVGKGKWG
jgi:rubredoxin